MVFQRLIPLFTALPLAWLASCTGPSTESPSSTPTVNTILIGEYGSLSGSEATFGRSTHNGIMLAIQELNAAGGLNGKPLEVRNYDDQGKAQEAGTAVTRLIKNDQAVAILGEVASSLSIAGGRVAQQYSVPMISPSSTNVQVTQIGDMISRVCFIDSFQGYVAAKFARDDLKAQRIAVLYDQSQTYSKGLKDEFINEFTQLGGEIVGEPQAYASGDQDFSAQLNTIAALKPDVLFLPGYYTDVGNIAIQARKVGITAPLLGGDGWDSAQLAVIGGPAIEGSYYSNHYSHEDQRTEVQEFVKNYQAHYNEIPDGLAALGYDATRLLFDAMKRSPSLDGKDLAKAIAETKSFQGVTGNISMDENRNAIKPAIIVKMEGGKPRYVTTIQPKGTESTPPVAAPAPAAH